MSIVEVTEYLPDTGWGAAQFFELDSTSMPFDSTPYMLNPAPLLSERSARLLALAQLIEDTGL